MSAAKPSIRLKMQGDRTFSDGQSVQTFKGRPAWAVRELIRNGPRGLRTVDCAATQLPFYIWQLRQAGVIIRTDMEKHGGPFAGHHARYVLQSEFIEIPPDKTKPSTEGTATALNSKYQSGEIGEVLNEI